jgi:hypothetical protein
MLMNTDKVFGENNTALNRQFYLNERNLGLCHPTINNADEPVLNVVAMINGVRQEYKFDLTS